MPTLPPGAEADQDEGRAASAGQGDRQGPQEHMRGAAGPVSPENSA